MVGFKSDCPECQKKSNCKIDIKDGKCINYITDNISHAQHRLFRGLLLPALTEALGESNNQFVHDFILKKEWIYRQTGNYYFEVKDYSEIPAKHQGSARIISRIESVMGERLQIQRVEKICGYIPSMANYTKAETKSYLKFCEVLLEEIGGQIPTESNQEYLNLREKVLK